MHKQIRELNEVLERHIIERTRQLDEASREIEKQIQENDLIDKELVESLKKVREILGDSPGLFL